MHYSFPATKFVKTNTVNQQLDHIASEIEEFNAEEPGTPEMLIELVDVYHSFETLFRILERDGVNVKKAFKIVKQKNEARGYYG